MRCFVLLLLLVAIQSSGGWELSDLLQISQTLFSSSNTLTLQQVSEMRM
jgi:hypothetical protein